MILSRRDLQFLLPMLTAANAATQPRLPGQLPSTVYHSPRIPYIGDSKKKGRLFFHGATHSGFRLEMHETILGPGEPTHAPHKHEHEEIVIVIEGTVETSLEGRKDLAEAGSVIYFGSNQMHSARNAGAIPCRYCVIELRGSEG
ncbi:MAG: cupin domain-containing protein [Acidobacteriia bacterium]|nr:cupin domain-containing protein [Terriglobia bacterium]